MRIIDPATPKKVCGIGLPWESIDVDSFVAFANLCDANDWTCGGTVYEGPGGSKWENLKRFCAAGGAVPVWSGGRLSVRMSAPVTSLDTITIHDLAEGEVQVVTARSWRDRANSVVPRFRFEDHRWEYMQGTAVTGSTYLAEDGELKTKETQFDLVQDKDQAAQLAAYEMVNGREFGPISMVCKPRLISYRIGEALTINLPEAGLSNQLAVITARQVDPSNGTVRLTFESETAAKHAYALGLSDAPPDTATIYDPELIDTVVSTSLPANYEMQDLVPVSVVADYTGAVEAGQLPRLVQAKLFNGTTDVTAEAAWSISVDSGSIAATIGAATGLITLDAPFTTSTAVVTATATIGTVTKQRTFSVTKQLSAPPQTGGGGGSVATDTSFATITSDTMAAVSDELTVTVGSAGTVTLTAPLTVTGPASGFYTNEVIGRWQWWDGAAWINQGAGETASDPDASRTLVDGYAEMDPGSISVSATKTGLTVGSSQKFRLMARNASGTRSMNLSGTASASGS